MAKGFCGCGIRLQPLEKKTCTVCLNEKKIRDKARVKTKTARVGPKRDRNAFLLDGKDNPDAQHYMKTEFKRHRGGI